MSLGSNSKPISFSISIPKPRNTPISSTIYPSSSENSTNLLTMRNSKSQKPTLRRRATLLSLSILGLSTPTPAQAQSTTSTWGLPFSVAGPSSTERLIPTDTASNVLASSAASVASEQISAIVGSETSTTGSIGTPTQVSLATDLVSLFSSWTGTGLVGSSFTVELPSPTGSGLTVSSPISVPSRTVAISVRSFRDFVVQGGEVFGISSLIMSVRSLHRGRERSWRAQVQLFRGRNRM